MTGAEIFMVVASAMKAAGALSAGAQASSQQKYQAQLADRDAVIAEQNRVAAIQQGVEDERRLRSQQNYALSQERARRGQSGIDPGTGSALMLSEQDETDAMLNVLTQRYQTDMRARGYSIGADEARASAGAFRIGARNSRTQGFMGAGTALLKGGAQVYGSYSSRPKP